MDPRQAEALQTAWLQEHVRGTITPKLLQMTRDIGNQVAVGDGDPTHAFPRLAGSHLSGVRHTVQGPLLNRRCVQDPTPT